MLFVDIGYLMTNSFAAFFGISPMDVPVERLGFYANQARQRPNTSVTSEHQHRWLLLGRALQAWRTTAKRPSKLRDNTALWGMLARLCDPLEKTFEHLFAGVMCPSIALHGVCNLVPLLAAVEYCGAVVNTHLLSEPT